MGAAVSHLLKYCEREKTADELILRTRSPLVLEGLVKSCQDVAKFAQAQGKKFTLLYLDGCPEPYMVESWMATEVQSESPNPIDVTELGGDENWVIVNRTLLRYTPILSQAINDMTHAERPMSLVRERDKVQVAVNRLMKELLGGTEQELTERVMTGYWLPGDREALQDRLKLEGEIYHKYEAAMRLSSDGWFYLEAKFKNLHDGAFTLSTNYFHDPRPVPALLQIPV